MMKIAKKTFTAHLVGLFGFTLLILLIAPATVSANELSQDFACKDGSSAIKIKKDAAKKGTKKRTFSVTCKSGSKIDYQLAGDVEPTNLVTASCSGDNNVGIEVDTPNKPVKYIKFYCVTGGSRIENIKPIAKYPTVKDTTSELPDTRGGSGDIKDIKDPAATGSAVSCTKNSCPLISKYVNPAIALLSVLVGIVAVIAIVVGGIQVTTSAGDPQQSASGKNHIRNAVIGVVAYVFLYAFLRFIVLGNDI